MPRPPTDDTCWHADASGPVRTTHAGRLAIPVTLRLGEYVVAAVDVVLDGAGAEELFTALGDHLAGRGTIAGPCRV